MTFQPIQGVHIRMPKAALMAIFDECDQFNDHETGGRILGTYRERGPQVHLDVRALIDSGPRAQRSAVSFFQDGDYQEHVFRQIEARHPEIEHLGNWHTHHMNGLQHLSSGDLGTYQRIVNHANHNTAFFYALLVTTKHHSFRNPLDRYAIKHYLFRRNDPNAYEIPESHVEIVDAPLLLPSAEAVASLPAKHAAPSADPRHELASDQSFISEFFGRIRPFQSVKLGLYWRGAMKLSNEEDVEAVVMQDATKGVPRYTVALRNTPADLKAVVEELARAEFASARAALMNAERNCNRALYDSAQGRPKRKRK
jgi:hypothetical protein